MRLCIITVMKVPLKNPEFINRQLMLALSCEVLLCHQQKLVRKNKPLCVKDVGKRGSASFLNGCMMRIGKSCAKWLVIFGRLVSKYWKAGSK